MFSLEHKSVLLAGAGGAVGSELLVALARHGARITALSLPEDATAQAAADMARSAGSPCNLVAGDVGEPGDVAAAVAVATDRYGGLDILINNAGRFRAIGALWEVAPQDWLQDVLTNLYGAFLSCATALPKLLEADRGSIVNVVGGGFDRPNPGGTSYAAAKAGVARLTDTLAAELDQKGGRVSVHGHMPGLVRSAMTERLASDPAGKRWLPHVAHGLDSGEDVPAAAVAASIIHLVEMSPYLPSGTIYAWDDDLDYLASAHSRWSGGDNFRVRWVRPAGVPARGTPIEIDHQSSTSGGAA